MFMCRSHWFSLRKQMRDAIWKEYRPGQEDDKRPSPRYMAVQRRAVAEVAFKPNDEKAAADAAPYALDAMRWRQVAIDAGLGDPLAGLAKEETMPRSNRMRDDAGQLVDYIKRLADGRVSMEHARGLVAEWEKQDRDFENWAAATHGTTLSGDE